MVNRLMGLIKRLSYYIVSAKAFIIISLLTFSLTIFTSDKVEAQNPNSNLLSNFSDNQASIVYAPIMLDGRELLHIAARKGIGNNQNQNTISPLQIRVKMYEENFAEIISTGFNPRRLYIIPGKSEQQTVILAGDRGKLKQRKLMSITQLDAQLHGLSVGDLAEEFCQIIRPALIQAQQERQPESLHRKGLTSLGIFIGIVVITLLFISWYKSFLKKWETLQEQQPQLNQLAILEEENATLEEQEDSQMMSYCQQKLAWQRKLNINRLKRWILVISLFFLWILGLAFIAGMFPYTRWLEDWLLTKVLLLAIILGTILGIKASNVFIDFCFKKFFDEKLQATNASARRISRLTTFWNVLKSTINFIWLVVGTLWFLEKLHIPILPILAGAGIVGFAISFSSQNLIRDIINGIIMLWEDQFIIGDLVNIAGSVGVVENVNLRMIQLRQANGTLSTISNSSISTVHNLTKDWSRIVFTIEISPDYDVDKAITIVKQIVYEIQNDEDWKDFFLDQNHQLIDVLGVNNISYNGIEIMLWFKTKAGKQFAVGREFRRRLKYAFDRENIAIGLPQHSLQLENSPALRLLASNGKNG